MRKRAYVLTAVRHNINGKKTEKQQNILQHTPEKVVITSETCQSSWEEGGWIAGVQDFLNEVYLYVALQSCQQLPDGAADASLLHLPAIQHLMHHLWQAVAVKVVLNGLDLHVGEAQAASAALPLSTDVVSEQIQVLLGHSAAAWAAQKNQPSFICDEKKNYIKTK